MPEDKLIEVRRVLYGFNQGAPVRELALPTDCLETAEERGFDLQAYAFRAAPEQLREPRVVKIGLIQNSIKLPTTAPYAEQRQVSCVCARARRRGPRSRTRRAARDRSGR